MAMFSEAEKQIKENTFFTAETLLAAVGDPPVQVHPNAVGKVVITIVGKMGLKEVGRIRSKKESSHGRKISIWRRN